MNRTDIAIAVAGHDGMVAAEVPGSKHAYRLNDERLTARFFRKYDTIVYTDSIETVVHPTGFHAPMPVRLCCGEANKTLGKTIVGAQYKREHILRDFYLQFPDRKWFVLTEEDGWWSGSQLLALLSNVDRAVVKEAKVREKPVDELPAFVSGGPAGSIDGPFMLMNRALIRELAGEAESRAEPRAWDCAATPSFSATWTPSSRRRTTSATGQRATTSSPREAGTTEGSRATRCTTGGTSCRSASCTTGRRSTAGPRRARANPAATFWRRTRPTNECCRSLRTTRNAHDSLPAFVQNGNRWVDAKPLAWSFFSEIAEIYKCCIHCKRTELHEYAKAEYALKHAMRNLVSWHHAKMPDIEWLDAVAAGNAKPLIAL